jgi:asparagine synthase (glutamine-hydrolysing)
MCGITGIYAFNEAGRFHLINLQKAVDVLEHRGPDAQGTFIDDRVGLGHRRLAVIDTSTRANQPMKDLSGRYTLIYNGEIYNYQEIKAVLEEKHRVQFSTHSDTEVLLYAYIHFGEKCLGKLNGFFSFAIYDKLEKTLFIARDRFGIKPLYFYQDEDKFLFASELRSIISYGIQRSLKIESLVLYLQLNYIPAPFSILEGVSKLLPGHYITIRNKEVRIEKFYDLEGNISGHKTMPYEDTKDGLMEKLENSIRKRLISDVPLGVFLSGGIDSSIITALASRHQTNLKTFSVGYKDARFFDEKKYALQVADHFKTEHHVFNITNDDLLQHLDQILQHFDEPFADSSAIPVYLLSKLTRNEVTVVLSGDGADEVFTGYNKHKAFYNTSKLGSTENFIKLFSPIWSIMPASRNNFMANKFRQLNRYAQGLKLEPTVRYWFWAGLLAEKDALSYFSNRIIENYKNSALEDYKYNLTHHLTGSKSINDILLADMKLVLPNDMLYKVDLMSMAHGLEVRVPFLDHDVVEFAFSFPEEYKINRKYQKQILRDILKDLLPGKLYRRSKHGFEVPLLKWFRKDLKNLISNDLLGDNFILEQGIFSFKTIKSLKKQLFSSNPRDAHAQVWALLVFQSWWRKYLG